MTKDTFETTNAAAQQTAKATEQAYAGGVENLRELSVALIDMARTNMEAAFSFARQAASARTPSEIANLWSAHVPKQLELLNAQTKQLIELGQKLASRPPGE